MVNAPGVKALAFDVFGTVTEWLEPVKDSLDLAVSAGGTVFDWTDFTLAWRRRSLDMICEIGKGSRDWEPMAKIHLAALKELMPGTPLDEWDDLRAGNVNHAWERLRPWPDAIPGLERMKANFTVAALSNGDMVLLETMAKNLRLPWDRVLSAEMVQRYKPDPAIYAMAAEALGLGIGEVMMVAAHPNDLRGAAAAGMRTAYVPRPDEYGEGSVEPEAGGDFDIVATNFMDLAAKLGA